MSIFAESFAHLLGQFGGDLSDAIDEAGRDCSTVGAAFHHIAAANDRLKALLADDPQGAAARESCARITHALNEAVIGLQFQDRMAQRILHLRLGLHDLERLLTEGLDRPNEEWPAALSRLGQAHGARRVRLLAPVSSGESELF